MSDQLAELARQYGGAPVGSPPPDFKASNVPVDARGVPLDAPRDARGQIITSQDEEPGTLDKLNEMLGPLAHPQTLTDFARLLTLPVDTVRKAAISAVTAAAGSNLVKRGASAAAKVATRGAAAVGDVVDPDVVGVISPRAGKVIQIAQKLRDRAAAAPQAIPPSIGDAADAAPPSAPAAAAPVAATPTNALPDQKLLNELAIQARRAGVKLTAQMEATAIDAVRKGATPQQAVQGFASAPAETAPATAAASTPAGSVAQAATKAKWTAAEVKEYTTLLKAGKTHAEALDSIEASRAFRARFGTPTPTAAETRFPKGMRGRASEED